MKKTFICVFILINAACNSDGEIKKLLLSSEPYENILGAYKTMQSDDLTYVPLLLKNAYKQDATTALKFKGVSVYEENMYALQHILKVKPPQPVTSVVDSVNVKFFMEYWQKHKR